MSAAERKPIGISVAAVVHTRLQAMAATAGMSLNAYATLLREAAYTARCRETGDVDLDAAVGRVALLFGTGFDAASIRQATGLSEAFVNRAMQAWRQEMLEQPSPAAVRVRRPSKGKAEARA